MTIANQLRSFRHRNFRILYPAMALSNIGTWAQRIAQDWLVLDLSHNDATTLGLVTALQFLPSLLLSLWGGMLADRFDKRKLMLLTNLGGGLGSALLGVLVLGNVVQLWHVYALAFAVGVFSAVDAPIRIAFNSELVGKLDLPNAVTLNSANFNLGRLIGPATSGAMIAAFGTGLSFVVNAVSYVAVLISLSFVRKSELHINHKRDRQATMADAWAYLKARRDIQLVMATVFFVTTFGLNFQIFNALMAKNEFHIGPAQFGALGTFLAIGSLSGALVSGRLEHLRLPRNIMIGAVIFGVSVSICGFAPSYLALAIILPFSGAAALLTLISANTYVQTTSDPKLRGRVMGIYLMIFMGGTPLGSPVIGFSAAHFGTRPTIVVCGLIAAAGAATLLVRGKNTSAADPL